MGGLLHLVQRGGDWAGPQPAQAPRCTNVTVHPSTASVRITVLLQNGLLLCGFNVPIKGLRPNSNPVHPIKQYEILQCDEKMPANVVHS